MLPQPTCRSVLLSDIGPLLAAMLREHSARDERAVSGANHCRATVISAETYARFPARYLAGRRPAAAAQPAGEAIPQDDADTVSAAALLNDLDRKPTLTCWRFPYASGASRRITHGHQRADGFCRALSQSSLLVVAEQSCGSALGVLCAHSCRNFRWRSASMN